MTANQVQQLPAGERQGIILWAGQHFGVDAGKVLATMKATCFRGQKEGNEVKEATDAEVAALLIVAREYKLNPFLKEIYAFPAKGGGIVPIVGIDGWISIVNDHPQYNGVEFVYDSANPPAWIECHIHRKDRSHPIKVRELLAECRRDTGPWKTHPTRMLRHKAFIQCARVAFGFSGIYDQDEGEAIVEGTVISSTTAAGQPPRSGAAALGAALGVGADTANASGTKEDKPVETPDGTLEQRDKIIEKLKACADYEILATVRDEANLYVWTDADLKVIDQAYGARYGEITGSKG